MKKILQTPKGGVRLCDMRDCTYYRTTSVLKVIRCLTCCYGYRDLDNYECRVRGGEDTMEVNWEQDQKHWKHRVRRGKGE